jgi:anti-anti-sigma factor
MSATRYCDSSGLSAILLANRICKEASGKFILCGLQENVEKLIQMAQLDKVLTVTKNQQQANEAIAE